MANARFAFHIASRRAWTAALVTALLLTGPHQPSTALAGTQTDIVGPGGSGAFGALIYVLPNGNIVVVDSSYDAPGPIADVGAVHLYNGATGALISTLTGSTAGDKVGFDGVVILTNGNFVVRSVSWDAPGPVVDVGAATWGSGTTGVSGVVSAANSLVGSTAGDQVGSEPFDIALANGNYVIRSPNWDAPGPVADVGAATWGSGTTGVSGVVSAANSLVGSTAGDRVGRSIRLLTNGNYVVLAVSWDAPGPVVDVGAATWGNGATGVAGSVSAANSLVGSSASDNVGLSVFVTALPNGNYVVISQFWDAPGPVVSAGAATWGSGTTGVVGAVSAANSLVGSTAFDQIGNLGVTVLTNSNYVVRSRFWDAPGPVADVGAATWGSGTTGVAGAVSVANSLVGSTAFDQVGDIGVTALTNGNYVVRSSNWDAPGPVIDVGAATWGNGTTGVAGAVSAANSLVGSTAFDQIGNLGVTVLTNSNYVVRSRFWDAPGPVADVGAATWGSGTTGVAGAVSAANSLVGSTAVDQVSANGVTVLPSGNYVVHSGTWDAPGPVVNVGAATWGSGTTGVVGTVSAANSLIGSTAHDGVGIIATVLANGHYVVRSQSWDAPGPVVDVGAATWGSGTTGVAGVVSAANSLVGSTANDGVGAQGVAALPNGNYVVLTVSWDAPGPVVNAGAATWGNGTTGTVGAVSAANSLVGATDFDNVAINGVSVLANSNYVVVSPAWDAGLVTDVGAVTWGSGTTGVAGAVSAANSLVGSTTQDRVGGFSVTALSNGNYVVWSPGWDAPGPVVDAGAATWGNGASGSTGAVSAANSLVGSTAGDQVGGSGGTALTNGDYVVPNRLWDAPGPVADAGAVTQGAGCDGSIVGPITAMNSVRGTTPGSGVTTYFQHVSVNQLLVVARPADNTVSLFVADDRDADCVGDTVEDGAPNAGDGDGDGAPDRLQGHVTSLPNVVDGDYLTLVAPAGRQLTRVTAVPNPSPGDAPAGVDFPVGFVAFQLFPMPAPPTSVPVSLLLQNAVGIDQYWRHGPESPMPAGHWYRFDPVTGLPATGATVVSPTQVDFTFVDGARGDDDLLANTILVDQGGPGGPPAPTPTPAPPTGVGLVRFTGGVEPTGRVWLVWETAAEVDIAGFHVERRVEAAATGAWRRVNAALIPARGHATGGAAYRLMDRVDPGQYGYRLVVVEPTGPLAHHRTLTLHVAAIRAFLPAAAQSGRGWGGAGYSANGCCPMPDATFQGKPSRSVNLPLPPPTRHPAAPGHHRLRVRVQGPDGVSYRSIQVTQQPPEDFQTWMAADRDTQ